MYFELDGTFPNHEANPIEAGQPAATSRRGGGRGRRHRPRVRRRRRPLLPRRRAATWCRPSTLTALIATRRLAEEPGATVIHNLITSRAVPEIVTELGGGRPTRVGHSFIKATMAETGPIFGGEHSGHFYFRDFWRAGSGMLAALHALAALAETDRRCRGCSPSSRRYVLSGEINSGSPTRRVIDALEAEYAGRDGVTTDRLGRPHREPRRLDVQRPPVQHRPLLQSTPRADHETMAERPWRRRARPDHPGSDREPRPRAAADHRLPPCCRADEVRARLVCTVRAGLPGARRHPRAPGRRSPQTRLTPTAPATWFDESRLDDEAVLEVGTAGCVSLAETGARVRRAAGDAAEATRRPVRGAEELARPARRRRRRGLPPARAGPEPWCPVRSWPGPTPACPAGPSLDLVVVVSHDGGDDAQTATAVAEAVLPPAARSSSLSARVLVADHAAGGAGAPSCPRRRVTSSPPWSS